MSLETLGAVAATALALLLVAAAALAGTRRWWSVLGTEPDERTMALPGDELVATAPLVSTRAIDIDAPVETAWAWLIQIGQDRGGFYSHAWLENLVGCRMRNAERVVPAWQHRGMGDEVPMHPRMPPLRVADVDPPRTLVLLGGPPTDDAPSGPGDPARDRRDATSWAFHLRARGSDACRLLVRTRTDWRPGWGRTVVWRGIIDPGHLVMERAMLRGIARRAARGGGPGGDPDDA